MPEMSVGDLAKLRQMRQWSHIFMVVHKPNTMFTGTIDSPDIAKGERFIPFDNGGHCLGYNSTIFVLDTFTDGNGTSLDAHTPDIDVVGGGWAELQGNSDIQGNEANIQGVPALNAIDSGISDGVVAIDVTTAPPAPAAQMGLAFRCRDANNFWFWVVDLNTGGAELAYYQGGVYHSVWTSLIGIEANHTYNLAVKLREHSIDCYIDGVWYTSTANSFNKTETEHGMYCGQIGIRFDNFEVFEIHFDDRHTTLWVGSYAGGRDIGIIRVRNIIVSWPYSGFIEVAENADILWADNLYLTVKDEHRIWPRFPRVEVEEGEVTWWKDYNIAHTNQTYQEPPVPIMGPPACAFLDEATDQVTLRFWGEDSYSPRETPLATGTWTFPHGTPATANTLGTEVAPHQVTWDTPGVYMVRLAITDANEEVSYGYRPVFILDHAECSSGLYPADDLFPAEDLYPMGNLYCSTMDAQDFEIRGIRGNFSTGGWTASIRVFRQADVEDFPEGAMLIIFAEDWYEGEQVSIGGYGHRENIVFVGWIIADSVRKEPMTGEITFLAHTVDGELRNCPAFSVGVERVTDTPDNWFEIQDMTLDLSGFYIGYWHSTLYEVSDVLESEDTRAVKYMDIPQSNLYNQLDKGNFAETIFARALSDRQSRFKYDVNPQYLVASKRDALDTIMTIQDEDWLGRVEIQEIQEKRISWVDVSGVRVAPWERSYGVYSIAPGDVPSPDGAFKQLTRLVADDQADMNRLAGFTYANLNKMHPQRTSGLFRVRVPLMGNYRVFDLHPQEWVLFPSLDTMREGLGPGHETGTPWPTGTRFIPRNIDIGFQNELGAFMVTADLEPETTGTLGESVTWPGQPGTGGQAAIVLQMTQNLNGTGDDIDVVFISEDLFADSPTWAQRHNGLPWFPVAGANFDVNTLRIDPFNSGKDDGDIVALLGLRTSANTYAGIYRNADLGDGSVSWVAVLTGANVLAQCYAGAGTINDWHVIDIRFDPTTEGWAYAVLWVDHSGDAGQGKIWGFETFDHGLTWTMVVDISVSSGGASNDIYNERENLEIMAPIDPNYMYLKIKRGANHYWLRSVNKGMTWAVRAGGPGTNDISLQPGQGSDDAYYDPAGSGWSLTYLSQMGMDLPGNKYSFGIRFPNAGLTQGATINSAVCHIKAFPTGQIANALTVRIRGVEEEFLPTFTTRGAWDAWGRTAAFVDWSPPNWAPGVVYDTPDLTAIIQELVNQAGWDSTCAIALDFKLTVSPMVVMRVAYHYESVPADTPILDINYDYATVTEGPSRPVALDPIHDRETVGVYWYQAPPEAERTVDGFGSTYSWFGPLGAGDGPVSGLVALGAHSPLVYITTVEGVDNNPGPQTFQSYLYVSQDGENWGAQILLPCAIAQSFDAWPWMISGETLMYLGNRTGDSVGTVDHVPLQFWISELTGEESSWIDKTGNLIDLLVALNRGYDRLKRIRPLYL